MKYKSIKIGSKEYSGDHQIEELLEQRNIFWLNDCEFEKAEIHINRGKVTWINGTWYNGIWKGDVWLDGDWFYGTWERGEWKGGTFHDGNWLDGVFEKGNFVKGEIKGGVFNNL